MKTIKKKRLIIPEQFECAGATVNVEWDDELYAEKSRLGESDNWNGKVKLLPNSKALERSPECIEVSFCHEVFHQVLDAMGREDLSRDEQFVKGISALWHQVLVTSEGDLNKKEQEESK